MCFYCLQERCKDNQKVCGYNPFAERVDMAKCKVGKISCEYCGISTSRKKPNRPMDFVFKDGVHLCMRCAAVKRCTECNGELSRLGCMLCRGQPKDLVSVLNKG